MAANDSGTTGDCVTELRCVTAALLLFVIVPALCAQCCRKRGRKARHSADAGDQGAGAAGSVEKTSASPSASADGHRGQAPPRVSDECVTPFSTDHATYTSDDKAGGRHKQQQPPAAQKHSQEEPVRRTFNVDEMDTLRSDSGDRDKAAGGSGGGGNVGSGQQTSDFNPTRREPVDQQGQGSYKTAVSKRRAKTKSKRRSSAPTQKHTAKSARERSRRPRHSAPPAAPFWRSGEPAPYRCHCQSRRQHNMRPSSCHAAATPFWRQRHSDNAQATQPAHRRRWTFTQKVPPELKFWEHKDKGPQ